MKPYVFTLWSLFFAIPMSAQDQADSTATNWERQLELKEVVVMASRTVVKQAPDRIIYLTKNDQYAKGMMPLRGLPAKKSEAMRCSS